MNAQIYNREGKIPGDGWFQIEVSGEFPTGDGRTQVVDDTALESIVNRFHADRDAAGDGFAGLLVDPDHLSHDLDNNTEALAWVQDLEIRNSQLHARLDLTDLGDAAVKGKRYKFFSTEYDPDDQEALDGNRVRPLRLSGLAFTNRPRKRGAKPISNRDDESARLGNQDNNTTNDMKAIAERLGLPADAEESAILTAIDSLLASQMDAEAEAIMNRHSERIPEEKRDEVKAELIKNRSAGLEMILGFKPLVKEAQERIHNRGGKSPEPVEARNGGDDAREGERHELVQGIMNRQGCKFAQAWSIARQQNPGLFA
jgi:phage I-like protein